jgi:putative chitinase
MTQLDIWRVQAVNRLLILVGNLQGASGASDALLDTLIRALSSLPARPADKPPYTAIFSTTDISTGRQKAMERLRDLAINLKGDSNPNDNLVDDLIRSLSNLPARPANAPPYASLFPVSKMIWLTSQQVMAIAPDADSGQVARLTPYLNRAMVEFEINTPLREAHFLAQVAHESDRFNALEEYASGEDYENREDLGNTYEGDGVRFKGRGLIQITGRANYGDCGKALGVDLVSNPTRLADPDLACRSAGWYWDTRELNGDADRDDVRTITRVINGGYNGLEDREQLLAAAKQVLNV